VSANHEQEPALAFGLGMNKNLMVSGEQDFKNVF
jgi:hypothetical protein